MAGVLTHPLTHISRIEAPVARTPRRQSIVARLLSIPMMFLFKGVAKKALLQDLNDIKSAVEQE
jgi:hypothetical protein